MPSQFGFPQAGDLATPPKYAVRASYTANVANLAAASTTCDTSVTLVEGDLVLLTEQSTASENGIYVVGTVSSGAAPLTRYEKMPVGLPAAPGTQVFISEGTARGNLVYQLTTNAPIVVGTTNLTFDAITQVASAPTISDFSNAAHNHTNAAGGGTVRLATGATLSFTAGDCAIATPGKGTHFKVPTTATNSTISLGNTGAARGDQIVFTADGTANGHTVTYCDGVDAISAAATAYKRHTCICTYDGAKWCALLVVGP